MLEPTHLELLEAGFERVSDGVYVCHSPRGWNVFLTAEAGELDELDELVEQLFRGARADA